MTKAQFDIREVRAAEIGDMLKLRNSMFGPLSRQGWDASGCTAVIAKRGRRIHGAIPLQYRDFVIRPGVSIPVAFENAVGVAEPMRSRGLGSAMIDCAAGFMCRRVDALYVYRGDERSAGYRFYRKTNHGDLYFESPMVLSKPKGLNNDVAVTDVVDAVGLEAELLGLFKRCYGQFGGYRKRDKGYFERVFACQPYRGEDWRLFLVRGRGAIQGYAIVNMECAWYEACCIYDFAAVAPGVRAALLAKIEWAARRRKRPVTMPANHEHPLFEPLLKRGYSPKTSTPYIMGRIIRAEGIFARLAGAGSLAKNLHLDAVTPHRDVILNHPARPKHAATLYLKESQLSRLLSCRLDVARALQTNLIRMSPLPLRVARALHAALRFCPWVSFAIDFT